MADPSPDWVSISAATVAVISLGWQVIDSFKQSKFANYENEFGRIESLVEQARELGIDYWTGLRRDTQLERKLLNVLDDLISKFDSLQDKRIIAKAPFLDQDLLTLKRAITLSDAFASNRWAPEPDRAPAVRRAADTLIHRFLMLRA